MFLQLDTSKDGTLSLDEIKVGLESLSGGAGGIFRRGNKNELKQLMRSLDKDGNGVIDYQEFIAAAADRAQLLNTKNLVSAF